MPEVIDAAYQPPGQRTLPHFIAFYHISSKTETSLQVEKTSACPTNSPKPGSWQALNPNDLPVVSAYFLLLHIIHYHPPLVSTFSGSLVSPCSGGKSPPSPNSHPGDARSPHARHNLYISWPEALRPLHRSWRYYKSMPSHCPTV